jgi:hypothetical protein
VRRSVGAKKRFFPGGDTRPPPEVRAILSRLPEHEQKIVALYILRLRFFDSIKAKGRAPGDRDISGLFLQMHHILISGQAVTHTRAATLVVETPAGKEFIASKNIEAASLKGPAAAAVPHLA